MVHWLREGPDPRSRVRSQPTRNKLRDQRIAPEAATFQVRRTLKIALFKVRFILANQPLAKVTIDLVDRFFELLARNILLVSSG
jgi:hypothetical protein